MKTKYEFEVRQIDAMHDCENWYWNASYFLFNFCTSAKDEKRAFLRQLHKYGIRFSVPVRVDYYGDIYEVVEKKTNMPLFAALPKF